MTKRKNAAKIKVVVKTKEPIKTPAKKRRERRKRLESSLIGSGGSDYLRVLENPFHAAPIRLGFGTAIPTSLYSGFAKGSLALVTNAVNFSVLARPSLYYSISFNSSATNTAIGTTASNVNCTNAGAIYNVAETARVVAMGLRVTVRYASTNPRGILAAVPILYDSFSNVSSLTYSALVGMEMAEWCTNDDGNGSVTMEVQYRPADPFSYAFAVAPVSNTGWPGSTACCCPVIVGSGWTAGTYSVDYQYIVHLESNAGYTVAGSDPQTIRDAGLTSDEALRAAAKTKFPAFTLDDVSSAADGVFKMLDRAHKTQQMFASVRGLSSMKTSLLQTNANSSSSTGSSHVTTLVDRDPPESPFPPVQPPPKGPDPPSGRTDTYSYPASASSTPHPLQSFSSHFQRGDDRR